MKRSVLPLLGLLLAAGCTSTTPPPPAEYLLQPSPESESTRGGAGGYAVALGRIDLAPYLDRQGIVVESSDGTVTAAQGHRWAEPLAHSLRRVLQLEIARDSGLAVAAPPRRGHGAGTIVDVDVYQFHGTEDGVVRLVADWTLRQPRDNRIVGHHQLVREMHTSADGYDALVRTHLALAEALGAAIARSIGEVDATAPRQP
ncbi:MAG: PqiC family protein [Pseudomonadales bacterium]